MISPQGLEFVLFNGRCRTDGCSRSSPSEHSDTAAQAAVLALQQRILSDLSTPSHLMNLWHFPCNLFSYTNDHQTVSTQSILSVLFTRRSEQSGCESTASSPAGHAHTGSMSAVKCFPPSLSAFHLTFDWRILFLYVMHIYLLWPICLTYLFTLCVFDLQYLLALHTNR